MIDAALIVDDEPLCNEVPVFERFEHRGIADVVHPAAGGHKLILLIVELDQRCEFVNLFSFGGIEIVVRNLRDGHVTCVSPTESSCWERHEQQESDDAG
jgi:hypothetical protein